QLHAELAATLWYGFAFGVNSDAATLKEMSEFASNIGASGLNPSADESFMAGNVWISDVRSWFEEFAQAVYRAMLVVEAAALPAPGTGATRLHHQDEHGSFVTYEFLRRKVFGQWAIDRGLVRGLLRHVWKPSFGDSEPVTLGDFGAGGAQLSELINPVAARYK
ncbi:unnamed protein product, partial [Polarella glacialis]